MVVYQRVTHVVNLHDASIGCHFSANENQQSVWIALVFGHFGAWPNNAHFICMWGPKTMCRVGGGREFREILYDIYETSVHSTECVDYAWAQQEIYNLKPSLCGKEDLQTAVKHIVRQKYLQTYMVEIM